MTTWLTGCTGNATCVEVAAIRACDDGGPLRPNCENDDHHKVDVLAIRGSQRPEVVVIVDHAEFAAFIDAVKAGKFDQLIEEN